MQSSQSSETFVGQTATPTSPAEASQDSTNELNQLKRRLEEFRVKKLDSNSSVIDPDLEFPLDASAHPETEDTSENVSPTKRVKIKLEEPDEPIKVPAVQWDPETEYEVEGIRAAYLDDDGKMSVLIKWKYWPSSANTWEPLENIECYQKIVQFLERRSYHESYFNVLMSHYVHAFLFSPLINIYMVSQLLDFNYSVDECVKLTSMEKSGLREALRQLDPITLRSNISKHYGSDLQFVRFVDGREPMCQELVRLHKLTRATLPNEAPIYFENLIDSDVPPANFTFIQDYIYEDGYKPQLAKIGCSCTDCAEDDCQSLHHDPAGPRSYLADGTLAEWARTQKGPIYECNSACQCPLTCYNRVTQRGRTAELVVFKTANDRGWGLRTHTPIKAWTYVMEYLGKVISASSAHRSEPTYQFELDFNVEQEAQFVVDAISYGDASHFINHSCNPNMAVINVWVNDLNTHKPRLAFFACRDIEKHEELTFDYNLKADPSKLKGGMRCRCNEPNCRGRL